MMTRSRIQTRIWLSIGIFVLGFLLTIVISRVDRIRAERELATLADTVMPAAQLGGDADAAFRRVLDGYRAAFLIQDRSGLDRASSEGQLALRSLDSIGAARDLQGDRPVRARHLAEAIRKFLTDASAVYSNSLPGRGGMTAEYQARVRALAPRTEQLGIQLETLVADLSRDQQEKMAALRSRSANMRGFMLVTFGATLLLSVALVHMTIQRSVLIPLARTQNELAHERDLLRILMDHVPDCIYFRDAQSRFVRINKAHAAVLGVGAPEDAIGHSNADYFDPAFAERTIADDRRILETGEPMIGLIQRVTSQGVSRWMATTKVPVRWDASTANMIVGIARDITEWKTTGDALEKSEESFRLLFDAIPHAVWVYNPETLRFLLVNETASRQYGYSAEEFLQIPVGDLFARGEAGRLLRALEQLDQNGPPEGSWKHVSKEGRELEVELSARVFRLTDHRAILTVVQDVTERKRLESDLHQAQRLEAVGHLAAGIAHEINTPIQFAGDNLHFIRDAFKLRQAVLEKYGQLYLAAREGTVSPETFRAIDAALADADVEYLNEELPKAMDQALDGVERVATIVRAMKSFAHPGQKEKMASDLNRALADTLTVARNELKYVADVETDFGDLPPVVCHVADLNQVFLNLLINAAHAIETVQRGTGVKGVIGVRTRLDADRIVISISDTGCGIPEAIRSRIFNPFFTTKEVGRGTGQGLSLARSIVVDKHGGRLTFEPNQPRGTTFVVWLPAGLRDTESAGPDPDTPGPDASVCEMPVLAIAGDLS